MRRRLASLLLACALCLCLAPAALADDFGEQVGYYSIFKQDGTLLFHYAGQVYAEDEYISGDNKYYRIVTVDDATRTAQAEFVEDFLLPEVTYQSGGAAYALAEEKNRVIAMYCTHTDESYVKGDGGQSDEQGQGGILDVAKEFQANLEQLGVEVSLDTTNHLPHDAGAYRRSRQTAVKLIEEAMPSALIDIHRDGIPDEQEYLEQINGEEVTKVRLEVGRSNPNRAANKEFAAKLKAVADNKYPGLVKDIFIGKGNYNQELMPRAILLEFGTHTSDKEQVLASTQYMAEVVVAALFGDTGNAQSGKNESSAATPGQSAAGAPGAGATPGIERQSAEQPLDQSGKGATSGILWVVGIALVGGLAILLLSTGGGKEFVANLRGKASEMTGGVITNRRKDHHDDDDRHS